MITVYSLSAFRPELKGVIRDIRVVWTLEELGVPYTRKVMDPMKGEHKTDAYKKINPFGKVPVIDDDGFTLFESAAICTYLGDKYSMLVPNRTSKERVIFDQWLACAISTIEPMAMRVFGFDMFTEKNAVTEKLRAEALASLNGLLGVLDHELTLRPYLAGETFSVVDLILSSVCRAVSHTEVTAKHQALDRYLNRNFERSAFEKALENNG